MKGRCRKPPSTCNRRRGFTLIEVIIIFVLGSILAAIISPYLGTSVSHSSNPVTDQEKTWAAHTTLELITADYEARYQTAMNNYAVVDLAALQTDIGVGNQNNAYGTYTVLENKFIQFDSGTEQNSAATHFLKVSIADPSGSSFTTIFSDQ